MKDYLFINRLKRIIGIKRSIAFPLEFVEKPKGKRIMVLAPHFDDEILGCGGTLRKHVLAKDTIKIVYITDGSDGMPWMKDKNKIFEIRKKESIKATSLLGINKENLNHLYEVDGNKKINKKSIAKLSFLIKSYKPDLIYLPWFLDNHKDHKKTNFILYQSLKKINYTCNICAYEIWSPLMPNIIVDIGMVFELKMKAIKCFKSQLNNVKYDLTFQGLNKYRSIYNRGKSYAEAFLYLNSRDYFKLAYGKRNN